MKLEIKTSFHVYESTHSLSKVCSVSQMSALPHKPCSLHRSLPCQPNPSKPPHHVPPNPRALLSPPTLHLRKRLPRKQRQHRLPNRARLRRLHDRHHGFLQQSFQSPGRPPIRINQRRHQLAGPALQPTHLRGPLGNQGGVLGYEIIHPSIHPSQKPTLPRRRLNRMLIVCTSTANFRVDRTSNGDPYVLDHALCVSLLGQASVGNGTDGGFGPDCEYTSGSSFGGWGNTDFGTVFAEAICPPKVNCLPYNYRPLACWL